MTTSRKPEQSATIRPIVHNSAPIALVGGGQATPADLNEALKHAPTCVAADGGAGLALAAGVLPEAVIGDLDSLTEAQRGQIPPDRLHRVAEQNTTDFEKALMRIEAPAVLGVAFTGGRMDHQLAVLHGLLAQAHKPCVLLAPDELLFLVPPRICLPTRAGDVVSLYPLCPVTGQSAGLRWAIDGLDFAPGRQIGTSNQALGPVELVMDRPGMVGILPRRLIAEVLAALTAADAPRWPAR